MKMGKLLMGVEALNFIEREGFSVLKSVFVQNEGEAAIAAATIGFPVSLKVSSPHIVHKTEMDGVRVCLDSEGAVIKAFREIMGSPQLADQAVRPKGIIVQQQGDGFELIAGVTDDQQFGPVIMVGLGGIFAETIRDVSFRLIPIRSDDAWSMIEELRGAEALKKPRKTPIDLTAVTAFLVRLSDCVYRHPEIREIDLNPVFVWSDKIEICDARVRID
jgi:hypothetical protein